MDVELNGRDTEQGHPRTTPPNVSERSTQVIQDNSGIEEPDVGHTDSGREPSPETAILPRADVATLSTAAPTPSPIPAPTHAAPSPPAIAPSENATLQAQPITPVPASVTTRSSPRQPRNSSRLIRNSRVSGDFGPVRTSPNKDPPQRKKSTLRATIGKLFGRKKKNSPSPDTYLSEVRETTPEGPTHKRSNTTPVPLSDHQVHGPQRVTSLPLDEYSRALRSHSIGPEDELAIRSARNSLNAGTVLSSRERAVIDHSYATHPRRSRIRDGELAGLAPRPVSAHGRLSIGEGYYVDNPDQIGRAITSDVIAAKRRSRSLSVLPGFEHEDDNGRRRSGDIRYWRESYDPTFKSPVSTSYAPEKEDAGDIPAETEEPGGLRPAPQSPAQPFVFGDLKTMNQMAGMKITQAVSMDARIGSLERRTRRLEKVTAQMSDAVPNFRPQFDILGNGSRTPSRRPTPSHGMAQLQRRPSTGRSDMTRASVEEPPALPSHLLAAHGFGPSGRPLSTATIRGVASLPTLTRELRPFTVEQYTTLMALLETERSARQALEAQVRNLNHQLHLISKSPAFAHAANGFGTPVGASFYQRSTFDYDYDDDEDEDVTHRRSQIAEKRVATQDSGIVAGGQDDDASSAYTTPREEGYSPSVDDTDDDYLMRRKAARTLSLSRMTMNRNAPDQQVEIPHMMI
jgi:hypothetical protein